MAEREASGDFDYLIGDLTEALRNPTGRTTTMRWQAGPATKSAYRRQDTGAFDAFDADTWYFQPDPPPWYRRKQALIVLIACAAAAAALVIAVVLLIVRSPSGAEDPITPVESTATTARRLT